VAATTRNKAPARWTALLLSGLASAGFLWGIVNAPGSDQAASSPTPAVVQAAAPTATPVVGRDDRATPTSVRVPSRQTPSTQLPTTVQPSTRQPRLRTRGS